MALAAARKRQTVPKLSDDDCLGMEAKLQQLRQSLALEKAARSKLEAKFSKTSIWGAGQVGSVKNFRVPKRRKPKAEENRVPPEVNTYQPSSQASRKPSAGERVEPVPPSMPRPQQGRDASSSKGRQILNAPPRAQAGARAAPAPLMPLQEFGARGEVDGRAGGGDDAHGIDAGPSAAEPSIADGNFDEEESHASFLEALKSWRGGGVEEDSASDTGAAAVATPIEVQTEPPAVAAMSNPDPTKARPGSARRSYFFRKMAQTQAAQKAAAAAMTAADDR